jgi:integrase
MSLHTARKATGSSLEKPANRRTRTPSATAGAATATAGLSGLRLHDLRHFYASGLIASGGDVVTVQRALGHASAPTILSTYSHLWPSAEDRTRAAAEGLALRISWTG